MRAVCILLCIVSSFLSSNAQQENYPTLPESIKASIPGQRDSVSLDALVQTGRIVVNNKAFTILGFEFVFGEGCLTASGMTVIQKCTGDSLSATVRQYMQRMIPGFKIHFDHILVENTIGNRYYVKPFSIKIKHS